MLEIVELSKSFEQKSRTQSATVHVLDAVSFEVPVGQFVCLLGPSGCGKTTLIRIISGLEEADSGCVLTEGQQVHGPGPDRAMVFQNYGLLPWRTVMGNVELGLEIQGMPQGQRQEFAKREIERVGLSGFEGHFPHQLSGGMQQRVGLARALAKDPKTLLMDEPFAAVDMQTREFLQEELLKIWSTISTTVIFVTHSIDEAIYLGDRVIVMKAKPGRIIADVNVDLDRPRYSYDVKASKRFGELRHQLAEALRGGGAPAIDSPPANDLEVNRA